MKLVTPPTVEPITVDEAKHQCRVDGSHDDAYLSALCTVAREHVEQQTRLALMPQTWEQYADAWPTYRPWSMGGSQFVLKQWPVVSVVSVTYRTADEIQKTFDPAAYLLATGARPARLVLKAGQAWPGDLLSAADPITVRFTAGYESDTLIPQSIKHAMLLIIGHLYENREQVVIGAGLAAAKIPFGVDQLLASYRSYRLRV